MGQRNLQYAGQMTDLEDQQGHGYIHPEPCIFYGSISNFSQPNIHPMLPASGNASNVSAPHPQEHRDNSLFFGMTQHNSFHLQHPAKNIDLAVATSSNPYNLYIVAPSASKEFLVPVNHGVNEPMTLSSTQRFVGVPTDSYGRSYPCMDGVQGSFKRKNAEGLTKVFPYHNALEASSSSVPPMGVWSVEYDVTSMDASNFTPYDYHGNEMSSVIENESYRSSRNRPGIMGSGSVWAHYASHLIQGTFVAQPFQLLGNPWLDMQFGNSGGDNDSLAWNQAPTLPYLQGSIAGGDADTGIMGIGGYQISSRNFSGLLHPHILQRHPNLHHSVPPMQRLRGHSINVPEGTSRSTAVNPFQGVSEVGPRYIGPVPPTGFRLYQSHQREDSYDMNPRHRNLPHLRVLPEDGAAMLGVPGYHEVTDSIDQHRDLRLDIDHMSYEELLALGEQIGRVATGVSEEVIVSHLNTRSLVSSASSCGREEAASADMDFNFCVICQTDYVDQQVVGTLDCGHEYHVDCIKRWLFVKNSCPICKSTALNTVKNIRVKDR